MHVDCDACPVRGRQCDGCMMTVLFGAEVPVTSVDGDYGHAVSSIVESRALARAVEVFTAAGLLSPSGAAPLGRSERAGGTVVGRIGRHRRAV